MFNQDFDNLLEPCEGVACFCCSPHGLYGEYVDGTHVEKREYQEVAELMREHVLEALAAGVVVEDAVLIGADAGEWQC